MMMSKPLIEIEDLSVHFTTFDGKVQALNGVDFHVNEGEIVGIVGESGCGKSVTSLVTIGLSTGIVDRGSIHFRGEPMIRSVTQNEEKYLPIIGRVTVFSAVAILLSAFWLLIRPVQGAWLLGITSSIAALAALANIVLRIDAWRFERRMRTIRGNEISMIFQEPMTALNPLYTVEKQIAEVMREHKRLAPRSVSTLHRILHALSSPFRILWTFARPQPFASSVLVVLITLFILADTNKDISDLIKSGWWFLVPFVYGKAVIESKVKSTEEVSILYLLRQHLPLIPVVFAGAGFYLILNWLPFSGVVIACIILAGLALPAIILSTWFSLDPAHEKQVVQILEDVRIPNPNAVAKMYPHELSGGMRQRVMIAMMMSCEPTVLIADEPTTALDVTIQAQILHLMRDLRDRKGTSIMLITHDMGVIAQMCDRVVVMYAGKVVETAPLHQILEQPRMPYTIGLLHSIPSMDPTERREVLPIIPGSVPPPNEVIKGCRFHARCPLATPLCVDTPPPAIEISEHHIAHCHHTDQTLDQQMVRAAFDQFAFDFLTRRNEDE